MAARNAPACTDIAALPLEAAVSEIDHDLDAVCKQLISDAALAPIFEPRAAPNWRMPNAGIAAEAIESYKAMLEDLPVAIYAVDTAGRLTFFNKAAAQLAGRKPKLGEDRWCVAWKLLRQDGTVLPYDAFPLAVMMRTGQSAGWVEIIAARPDGRQIPLIGFATPLHDKSGALVGGMNTLIDITAQKQTEAKLDFLNHHDLLTEIPNQAAFETCLEAMLSEAGREKTFALVSLDLDNFSRVNDMFGRRIGDQALRRLGARLNRLHPVRCFRPGGDNIFMIIPGSESEDFVRRMLEELAAGWRHDLTALHPTLQVTFSAGIAYHHDAGETATAVVASAKAALKRAKREERGAIRFYDVEKDRLNRDSGLLMEDLRAAIGTEALSLYFQPLARQSGAINGFEALIRWNHPVHGRLLPNHFIPLAEESGLIIPLSAWILRTACTEATGWGNGLRVSVNLSPVQFEHPGLAELVRDILADTGLPPDRLTLEVTEGVLIANYAEAMGILSEISALGVAIALDDFGTGYSSLSYLHEFPLSEIKIDKCFTSALGRSRRSEAIVRSVIELGHALGLRVVVEGVERHDQMLFIESTKCDLVQGYLIGRPLPGADSKKLINADASTAVPSF
jgi:diguanylate cyclase (GGDEF)-like protein/PAS domain S-box-containing protein